MPITLDDLLAMPSDALFGVMRSAHPLDLDALADTTYTGIDLSMPALFHRLFWRSFRKTFHRDPASGRLRGWNVRVRQVGWSSPPPPLLDRHGRPITFGHYEVRSAVGVPFPRGWAGSQYLDYRAGGNRFADFPARAGHCPLVRVNPGDDELLLGWEIFRIAGVNVPLDDFWVLRREGPLAPADVLPRPDGSPPAPLPPSG